MLKHKIVLVPVGGRAYASGLFWQPMRSSQTAKKDAREFAKAHGFDYVTYLAARGTTQCGFAPLGAGRVKGSFSLATALAESLGDSWIAAFVLPDGSYAMAAAHAGLIMAGSDVNGTELEVRAAFNDISALALGAGQEWGQIIAPAGWSTTGNEIDLANLLGDRPRKTSKRIKPLTFRISKLQAVIALASVVLLLVGGLMLKGYLAKRDEEARLARIEKARIVMEEQRRMEQQETLAQGPWSTRPAGAALIEACSKGWSVVPFDIHGWMFDNGRCSTNQLTAVYRRGPAATVAAFVDGVRTEFGEPVIKENGDVAAITFTSQMDVTDEGELPVIGDQVKALLSHLQQAGVQLELSELKKGGVPAPVEGEPEPVALWHAHEFSFTTRIPPMTLFARFNRPGMRINQIDLAVSHETAEMTWTVAGDIYGK